MNRPNFLVLQGSRDDVAFKSAAMQAAHSSVRTDPEIALTVFQQRARAEVAKPVRHLKICECASPPTAHSFIGSDPHAAVSTCQEGADKVVNQPFLGRVVKEPLAHLTV